MKKIVLAGLICLNANFAMSEITTEDLTPDTTITTDSLLVQVIKTPEMHEPGSVFSGSSGIETPSMDVPIQPMPPFMNPSDFTPSQLAQLAAQQKAAYILKLVREGKLPPGVEIRVLSSKRSVQEDLELYFVSAQLNVRALEEGKKGEYYIEMIKNGKSLVEFDFAARSLEQLRRDVETCGTGFEIFEAGSGKCSNFRTLKQAAEHHWAAGETIKERDTTIAKLKESNQLLYDTNNMVNKILESKLREVESLKATVKRLKKGRK